MKREQYRVVMMDVWGNPRDGWEINNWYRHGSPVLETKADPSARDIFNALKRDGWIKPGMRFNSIGLEWTDGGWFVTDERRPSYVKGYGHGKPEYVLERVTE